MDPSMGTVYIYRDGDLIVINFIFGVIINHL